MRRYSWPCVAIAVVLLLGGAYFVAQRQIYADTGLVLQQKFPNHNSYIYTADFDENEQLVASGGEDGLRVWRLDNAHETFHKAGVIQQVRFVRGGSLMVVDAAEGLILLACETWQTQRTLGGKGGKVLSAVSYGGDKIAASFSMPRGSDENARISTDIHVWRFENDDWHELILRGHKGPVFGLEFLPDCPFLISRGEDGLMHVWDLTSGKQVNNKDETLANKGHRIPESMTSSALTRLLAVEFACDYAKGSQNVLRTVMGKVNGEPKISVARTATFSLNKKWIATGHENGTLRLWDANTLVERAVAKGSINGSPLNEVRFSRSGKLIVTASKGIVPGFAAISQNVKSDDTVVRVWRVNVPDE